MERVRLVSARFSASGDTRSISAAASAAVAEAGATFDAPSREICQQRRLPSNTPLQSLTLLNDEAFEECARALADRIDGNEGNLATKLAYGFLLTTSHPPRSGALNELERLYKRLRDTEKASHSEALTVVASVLINLDAALTK